MNTHIIILSFSLMALASISHSREVDFCVADPRLPEGPEGYSCKDPANVTVDDFIYTGFRDVQVPNNIFNFSVELVSVDTLPALNGLGISITRIDLGVGGAVPIHAHRPSEFVNLVRGNMTVGFVDTKNVAYYKTLQVGDVMIIPGGLLHFLVNSGQTPALAYGSLNNVNPGQQIVINSLVVGTLPTHLVEKTTLLSHDEVLRIKNLLRTSQS